MRRIVKIKGQGSIEVDEDELSKYLINSTPDVPAPKKYTKYELQLLNKDDQIALLNKLGETDVPKLEKDRINLLIKRGVRHDS